eukprot:scaffold15910_cov193-Amphora_coffeaeformis.AAC.11
MAQQISQLGSACPGTPTSWLTADAWLTVTDCRNRAWVKSPTIDCHIEVLYFGFLSVGHETECCYPSKAISH